MSDSLWHPVAADSITACRMLIIYNPPLQPERWGLLCAGRPPTSDGECTHWSALAPLRMAHLRWCPHVMLRREASSLWEKPGWRDSLQLSQLIHCPPLSTRITALVSTLTLLHEPGLVLEQRHTLADQKCLQAPLARGDWPAGEQKVQHIGGRSLLKPEALVLATSAEEAFWRWTWG